MPSGTASRLCGPSAVRSRIQESKSICLTFLSERLCLHLRLPLPPSLPRLPPFQWLHLTVRQHHTEMGTLPRSRPIPAGLASCLSVHNRQWICVCMLPFVPGFTSVCFTSVFTSVTVCVLRVSVCTVHRLTQLL